MAEHSHSSIKGYIYFQYASVIHPWIAQLSCGIHYLELARNFSFQAGDVTTAGQACFHHVGYLDIMGEPLENVQKVLEKYMSSYSQDIFGDTLIIYHLYHQKIMYLLGQNQAFPELKKLNKNQFNDLLSDETRKEIYQHLQGEILFFQGKYREACHAFSHSWKMNLRAKIVFLIPSCLYYSLSITALYTSFSSKERQKFLKVLNQNLKLTKRLFTKCPNNFAHIFYLISAEKLRILGKLNDALEYYNQAIEEAEKNGFVHHKAIASEFAARAYLIAKKKVTAQMYLQIALQSYSTWGAQIKVQQIQQQYASLLVKHLVPPPQNQKFTTTVVKNTIFTVQTMLKMINTTVEELEFEKLLPHFLKIIMENTGATKGLLLLNCDGTFEVHAKGIVDKKIQTEFVNDGNFDIATTVIRYVARTKKAVLLNNFDQTDHPFVKDSYWRIANPKSFLCSPMQNKGKMTAILCLENHLMYGVFDNQTEIVEILSGQAAVAIENAKLYQNLRQEMQQKLHLQQKILEISDLEKLRIGNDLHDSLGQQLFAIELISKTLHKKLVHENSQQSAEQAQQMIDLIKDTVEQARSISKGYSLLHLKSLKFLEAIQEIVDKTNKIPNVVCNLRPSKTDFAIHDIQKIIHVYRIIQEAINNALKHGKAKKIEIHIEQQDNDISLHINNDGKNYSASNSYGLGIFTMQCRAQLLKGKIEIKQKNPWGTSVCCRFPANTNL